MSALMNVHSLLSLLFLLPSDRVQFSHALNACAGQIQSNAIPNMLLSPSSLSSLFHLKWETEPGWRSHSRLWKDHLRVSPPPPPPPPFQRSCSFHKFKFEIYVFRKPVQIEFMTYFTSKIYSGKKVNRTEEIPETN